MSTEQEIPTPPAALDDVDAIRAAIVARIGELAPSIDEASSLRRAVDALDGVPASPSDGGRRRAMPGERAAQLVEYVTSNPGRKPREAADAIDVAPTAIYALVNAAIKRGEIVKRDGVLHPMSGEEAPPAE